MKRKRKKSGGLTSRSLKIVHENGFPKVTDVVDADEPLEAEVTANDVSMGTRKQHRVCPYATACKRVTRCPVIVSRAVSYVIMNPTTAVRYMNSMALQTQIKVYDQGGDFEPGWYALMPHAESHRIGMSQYGSGTSGSNRRNGKKKRHRHFSANVRTVLGAYKPAEVVK